ncbi:MAG TPA: tetratricopeptide repeat protein [Chthoniobacterales bacterium]
MSPSESLPSAHFPTLRLSWPAGIFVGVLLVRLLVLVRLSSSNFLLPSGGDMQFYNAWALRILHGEWTTRAAFYGLPLYAYLLAAIYKIAGYNPFLPALLQAALDGGTAVLLYRISEAIFANGAAADQARAGARSIGLLAAIGWTFFQPAAAYSAVLMPTSWLVFVFWWIVWEIVRTKIVPRHRRLFSLGCVIGVTAMGVATILFLVPLLVAALFLRWPGTFSRRASGAAFIVVGVFIGTSPAWIHNYFVARDPVFLSAHSGINFWIGNNPAANGYPRFPPGLHASQQAMLQDSITAAEKVAGRPLRRSEVSAFWSAKAAAWIAQNPGAWMKLLALKIKNFWNAYQYDDLSIITALRDQSIIFCGLGFGLVAALALPGLVIACGKFPAARWLVAALLLHMFSLLSVFVTERYRLAAAPGLILFAAFGIFQLWENLVRARMREAAIFGVLLFGATGFVSLPQKDPSLWALDPYNSGLQALDAGDLPLARAKLDRAYAYAPRNAEINFAEGNLSLAEGHVALSKNFYRTTLQLDPQHVGAFNNLGLLALNEKRYTLARHFFAHALAVAPNDAKLCYLFARAAFASGDLVAARNAISAALQLDSSRPEFVALKGEIKQATLAQ